MKNEIDGKINEIRAALSDICKNLDKINTLLGDVLLDTIIVDNRSEVDSSESEEEVIDLFEINKPSDSLIPNEEVVSPELEIIETVEETRSIEEADEVGDVEEIEEIEEAEEIEENDPVAEVEKVDAAGEPVAAEDVKIVSEKVTPEPILFIDPSVEDAEFEDIEIQTVKEEVKDESEVKESLEAVVLEDIIEEDIPEEVSVEEAVVEKVMVFDVKTDEDEGKLEEPESVKKEESKTETLTLADSMMNKFAWTSDRPGSLVKDVRSAISLNDRILFINCLFKQNPIKFQEVISEINEADNFNTLVKNLYDEYPEWDFSSEVIYRFMMAIRRRFE